MHLPTFSYCQCQLRPGAAGPLAALIMVAEELGPERQGFHVWPGTQVPEREEHTAGLHNSVLGSEMPGTKYRTHHDGQTALSCGRHLEQWLGLAGPPQFPSFPQSPHPH